MNWRPEEPGAGGGDSELMKLMVVMNESVKNLAQRFDKFQSSIEAKVTRLEGEMMLVKNKVNMIESKAVAPIKPAFDVPKPSYPVNLESNLTAKNLGNFANDMPYALKEQSFGTGVRDVNPFKTQHTAPAVPNQNMAGNISTPQ